MKTSAYTSWSMLVLTVILCVAAGFAVVEIRTLKEEHAGLIVSAQERAIKDSSLDKLRALVADTKAERTALISAIPTDVLMLVDMLDALGSTSGVDVEISNAQPLGLTNTAGVTGVAFVIKTKGSFAQVTRLAALLSSLPLPSIIDSMEILRDEDGKTWNLNSRVKFLVTAPSSP